MLAAEAAAADLGSGGMGELLSLELASLAQRLSALKHHADGTYPSSPRQLGALREKLARELQPPPQLQADPSAHASASDWRIGQDYTGEGSRGVGCQES